MPNNEPAPILQVRDLQVEYPHKRKSETIVRNISFELRRGETLALLGESGSGKSTIAKAIAGLLPNSARVSRGTLRIGTADPLDLTLSSNRWIQLRGRQIGTLFQDARLALNPLVSIKEHFKESLLYHRLASADQVDSVIGGLLSKLNFPEWPAILECYPYQLSGGMCQRICLALTLSLQPLALIADEPTSALDTVSQKEVLDLLKRVQQEFGLAVLFITHDIGVANAISDRVIVLRDGTIQEEGESRTVFARPQAEYTRQLLASRSQIAKPTTRVQKLPPDREPELELVQLDKTFQQKRVLQDVNLTIGKGEIVGILGQSGCGKSTLARCIAGLETADGGRILYRGTDISRLQGSQRRQLSQYIQLIFQDARASLNPGRTAAQLVQEPLRYLNIGHKNVREATARQGLHEVGILGDWQDKRPPQLSSGQCQRIAIARALVMRPDLLICDEPVSALDMTVQAQIVKLLSRLHKQYGFSIIMISHDIRVLQSMCHRIAVMNAGRIEEVKEVMQIHKSPRPYTQLLLKCAGDLELGL